MEFRIKGVAPQAGHQRAKTGFSILKEMYKNDVMAADSTRIAIRQCGQTPESSAGRCSGKIGTSGILDMNRNGALPMADCPLAQANSDDENYINRRLQRSVSPNNKSDFHNNNDSATKTVDDIRDHLWYHGSIGRSRAEAFVSDVESGHFLVRDCISRGGNYVLTCNYNGKVLHFMINRSVISKHDSIYERAVYHFEDDSYQSVPDLIRAYVGQKKSISDESQCIISKPINRLPDRIGTIDRSANRDQSGNNDQSIKIDRSRNRSAIDLDSRKTASDAMGIPEKAGFILDDEREQGNYVIMRENRFAAAPPGDGAGHSAVGRSSISAQGIANLKIPPVPPSIRNRPLPPVPMNSGTQTLRSKVMIKEARRQQLNKWRSESALEDRGQGTQSIRTDPRPNELHGSTSVQSLNKCDSKLNNPAVNGVAQAPEKPKRAPSIKKTEKPMLVIKDAKTGRFREIAETELPNETDDSEEDEECDYHEYCDIDYDQLPPTKRTVAHGGGTVGHREGTVDHGEGAGEKGMDSGPRAPPLPPRPKPGAALSIQDRDSACVPDMIVYDQPSHLCKPYPSKAAVQSEPSTYDIPRTNSSVLQKNAACRIDLANCQSSLLPLDAKPLDKRTWTKIRDLLSTADANALACAATKVDAAYMNSSMHERLLDCVSSDSLPSLILLPHGAIFRRDLIERATCLRYFVASTLLHEQEEDVRVKLLSQWIDIAHLASQTYANYFAFGNIMTALLSPQVSLLHDCWHRLQLTFQKCAANFNEIMKPRYYAMRHCLDSSWPPSECTFCIPDLEPLSRLLNAESIDEIDWEEGDLDNAYGLDSFWRQLQNARTWPSLSDQWRCNLDQLQSNRPGIDCTIESVFRTEFHLRYLFGAKGSTVAAKDRYVTFQRILTAMASNIIHKPV